MLWRDRIVSDPAILNGQACIKSTRIPVSVVIDKLAAGLSDEQIIASYRSLSCDDIEAARQYAAELARTAQR